MNLKIAKSLRLTSPEAFLPPTDEVIDRLDVCFRFNADLPERRVEVRLRMQSRAVLQSARPKARF